MKYPTPPVPELSFLIDRLTELGVSMYLRGYLASREGVPDLPFVDICHECAARLQNRLPVGLRLIYPFPMSSQACIDGQPDPLQCQCQDLLGSLREHRPAGYPPELFESCFEGLVDQARYVTQHAPSRVVLTGELPAGDCLERWLAQLGVRVNS